MRLNYFFYFICLLLIVSVKTEAKTIICGTFPLNNSKKKNVIVSRIWNLLLESETREIIVSDSTNSKGYFKLVFDLKQDEILVLDGAGYGINLYVKKGDSLFIKVYNQNRVDFPGSKPFNPNKELEKNEILIKDNYFTNLDLTDSLLFLKVVDSIQKLLKWQLGSAKPENVLFNNYKYAELIGKQYLILDYIERSKKLNPELTQMVDDIWEKIPTIGSAGEKSRAYINSCYFYCNRIVGQYKKSDKSEVNLYTSGLASLRMIDSVFKKNNKLLSVLISSRLKSLVYLSRDSAQLADALSKRNEYKDYITDGFTKSAIEGEISRKKAQLQILFAKNFTLTNAKGDSITLSHLKSEFILLDFWATWCAPCIRDILKFRDSSINYGEGVKIVFINVDDTYPKWMSFLKKNTLVADNFLFASKAQSVNIKESYGFYQLPHKVLLDTNRKIVSSGSENVMNVLNNRLSK